MNFPTSFCAQARRQLLSLLLIVIATANYSLTRLAAQDINMNAPILPLAVWEPYASEEEALAKANSSSVEERRKAGITLFLISRKEGNKKNKKKALELAMKSSEIFNRLYRRNRNDMFLALFSGQINLNVADQSSKLKDKISYTNRGLANYEFSLPNIPGNLEALEIYLRTTVYIPKFFKDLTGEQKHRIKLFLDGYDAAMARLSIPQEKKRLEKLRTYVMIIAAQIANRSRKTRGDVPNYLDQVDTSLFPTMRRESNGDLVEMYEKLK